MHPFLTYSNIVICPVYDGIAPGQGVMDQGWMDGVIPCIYMWIPPLTLHED